MTARDVSVPGRAEDGRVVVVPDLPDRRPRRFAKASLTLDATSGQVEVVDERGRATSVPLSQVAGVVLSINDYEGRALYGRLLLVDAQGATLAKTRPRLEDSFRQAWNPEALAPLGLPVSQEELPSTHAVQEAHPGACPRWWLTTKPYNLLLSSAVFIVLFFGFGVFYTLVWPGVD